MLLLVTDTSGKHGSVALARAGEGPSKVEVIEAAPLVGGTFSAQLVPQIAALLARHGLAKTDIGAFVVVSGPGSFTGLRVGLAAIKALAEVLKKPIVPVSLLEVVAWSAIFVVGGSDAGAESKVFPYAVAFDAGRGEAFVGEFRFDLPKGSRSGTVSCVQESLLTHAELAELKESGRILWLASPDSTLLDYVRTNLQPPHKFGVHSVGYPGGAAVAWLGWKKLQEGQAVMPEKLEANYIRRSDAEIFAKPGS
jgi:tRNA threonylcarbamoyladenosine biosynthesis protein TsaB